MKTTDRPATRLAQAPQRPVRKAIAKDAPPAEPAPEAAAANPVPQPLFENAAAGTGLEAKPVGQQEPAPATAAATAEPSAAAQAAAPSEQSEQQPSAH